MANKLTIWDDNSKQRAMSAVAALNIEKPWVLEIKRKTEGRTLSQNALYHKWIDIIRKDQGNDHDDQGQIMMKHLIGPTHEATLPDGTKEPRWSSARLTVAQMGDYMDALARWAASEGIVLFHPEDAQRRE